MLGKPATLITCEPKASSAALGLRATVLFDQMLDEPFVLLIQPSGKAREQEFGVVQSS